MKKIKILSFVFALTLIFVGCGKEKNTNTSDLTGSNPSSTKPPVVEKCEHYWEDATCEEPKVCCLCGEKDGVPKGHIYEDATCLNPAKCKICGKTSGEAFGHDWVEATCTKAKHCTRCNKSEGSKLAHKWVDATCSSPKHCSICKVQEGKPLEHDWELATCEAPKTCKICKKTDGSKLEHTGGLATCSKKAVCEKCKKEYGDLKGHKWLAATCTTAKTCSECKITEGKALGHKGTQSDCTIAVNCTVCNQPYLKAGQHQGTVVACNKDVKCTKCKTVYIKAHEKNVDSSNKCKTCGIQYYFCECEGLWFDNNNEYNTHMKEKHPEKTCQDCGLTYNTGFTHQCKTTCVSCDVCNWSFTGPTKIAENELKTHQCKQETCKLCGATYVVTDVKHFCAFEEECPTCEKVFTNKAEYDEHIKTCTLNPPFTKICDKCGLEYVVINGGEHNSCPAEDNPEPSDKYN